MAIPDTSLEASVSLDSIRLTSDTISDRVTLGQVAEELPWLIQQQVYAWHDSGFSPNYDIPPLSVNGGDPYNINAGNYFDWALLESGDLVVEITNEFPMDIASVDFVVENASDNSQIANVIITDIERHTTKSEVVALDGKYMESDLIGYVNALNLDTLFAHTEIDTGAQYVDIDVVLRDLVADSAKAVFPEQTVINSESRVRWDFGDLGIELTEIKVKSGKLKVSAYSDIGNPMEFIYRLPSAIKDGQIVEVTTQLGAGSPGNPAVYSTDFDLSGYQIGLTITGDSVNLFPQHFIGNLIYTGQSVEISDQNRIDIEYELVDIV
ncbi:MAG: hypothetical protein AAF570_28845, partial [Bacteroidota bacterium]